MSAGRSIGELPQPIATSEVLAYAELVGMNDPDERHELLVRTRRLDGVWLNFAAKRQSNARA